jgi:membrane associated rhomboid family serine protease
MIYFVSIIVFVASLFLDTNILGYHESSSWYTRFTYIFASTNILHLAINLYAYSVFNKVFQKLFIPNHKYIAFIVAILATFGTEQSLPTVGLSGVVYAMLGITCAKVHTRQMILSMLVVLAINVISFFFGQSNVFLHCLCFTYSLIISLIYENCKIYFGILKGRIEDCQRKIQKTTQSKTRAILKQPHSAPTNA